MIMQIDLDKQLLKIKENFNYYINDSEYIFKSVNTKIVIMSLCNDSITNENRSNIKNNEYAKYRTNKAHVELIFNKLTLEECQQVEGKFIQKITKYMVGKIIVPDSFDLNLDNVCSNGIHYYKNIECAFYHDIEYLIEKENKWNKKIYFKGLIKEWKQNGDLDIVIQFRKNKLCTIELQNIKNIGKVKISNYKKDKCDKTKKTVYTLQTFDKKNKITSEGIIKEFTNLTEKTMMQTDYSGTLDKNIAICSIHEKIKKYF